MYRGGRGKDRGGGGRGRFQSYSNTSSTGRGGRSSEGFRAQQGRGGQGGADNQAVYRLCRYNITGSCGKGDSCSYSHALTIYQDVAAHKNAVKCMAMLDDSSRILTGSIDHSVKIWNPENGNEAGEIKFQGEVSSMKVKDNFMILSVDIIPNNIPHGDAVGQVILVNLADNSRIECKRSEELPYTHPQPVRAFEMAINDGVLYLITAGGEGLIRTWKLNQALGNFEHLSVLEGHTRGVTSLLLQGNLLWSGSMDKSIRCWDIGTGKCVGILTSLNGGHIEPITCLEAISMDDNAVYVASGGADRKVIIWDSAGVKSCEILSEDVVTVIKCLHDAAGNRRLLVGLATGVIVVRSLTTNSLQILVKIDSYTNSHTSAIWSIVLCGTGSGYFASTGQDGRMIIWHLDPLDDQS